MTYQETIEQLKKTDLKNCSPADVKKLISSLGKFGFMQITLHPGNEFIRSRPLNPEETIKIVNDLSYKPQKFNNTYQRASTPNNTMFYAGLVQPEHTPDDFLAMGRMIGLMEGMPLMRDKDGKGIQKLAFGKWTNRTDLNLAAIVFNEEYSKKNPKTENLFNAFREQVKDLPEILEKSLAITDFLAAEFAKPDISHHHEYMISALFSEICVEKGFDGIMFPSVRTMGLGLNVAITAEFINSHMNLVSAGECTIYKNGDHTIVLNDTVSIITEGQEDLNLMAFDNPENLEEEKRRVIKELDL